MSFIVQKERGRVLARWFSAAGEIAYFSLRVQGLRAEIEFPSDWHERRRTWVRLGFGLGCFAFSVPYRGEVVDDDGQCSGPTYGFVFFDDLLMIHYGKSRSRISESKTKYINMPWSWRHREHKVLGEPQSLPFTYQLKNGEVQHRVATIKPEVRQWHRWWLPSVMTRRYIDVMFDAEVGEQSGSWKGGVTGCSYDSKAGESPQETLLRMQRDKEFA